MSWYKLTRREMRGEKKRKAVGFLEKRGSPEHRRLFDESAYKLTVVIREYVEEGIPPTVYSEATGEPTDLSQKMINAYKSGRLKEHLRMLFRIPDDERGGVW